MVWQRWHISYAPHIVLFGAPLTSLFPLVLVTLQSEIRHPMACNIAIVDGCEFRLALNTLARLGSHPPLSRWQRSSRGPIIPPVRLLPPGRRLPLVFISAVIVMVVGYALPVAHFRRPTIDFLRVFG
jgi:hypothetical protein